MTGPSSDHTTGSGHYLYIEANGVSNGDTARLLSAECSSTGPQCLQFWYHMSGSAQTMGLHVYLLQDNLARGVWWKRNDQGDSWRLAQVDLMTTGPFKIIFEGRRGTTDQSDVAIDDVSLHHGHCANLSGLPAPTEKSMNPSGDIVTTPCSAPTTSRPEPPTAAKSDNFNPLLGVRRAFASHSAPSCPNNSHYTPCISSCQPTCKQLHGPPNCHADEPCIEGCECDDGFVLKQRVCVPIPQCGCVDSSGKRYHFKESWYTEHCRWKCECDEDDGVGEIDCGEEDECEGDAVCLQNDAGQYFCKSTDFSGCSINGDPEYRTFDHMKHEVKGWNSYIMVQTTGLSINQPDILIQAINEMANQDAADTNKDEQHEESSNNDNDDDSDEDQNRLHLTALKIRVYNHTVEFRKNREVVLDGRSTRAPVSPAGGLRILEHSSRVYLKTDFGLSVEFDGHSRAEIILPHTYKRRVGGLCGNFDGKKKNDMIKPDGTQAKSIKEFGESWRVME
ncbi:hypothetical protein UPYG_G00289040 [Umbra pygmaea]|uniref:Zonadhesin n=1 Tax=Umbra pygmaea TaxID=75934 RepID=A0ABD0WNW7_UMBPY